MAKSYLLGIISLMTFGLIMVGMEYSIELSDEFPEHFWLEVGITFFGIFLAIIFVDGFKKINWSNHRPNIYYPLALNMLDLLHKICIIIYPISIYYINITEKIGKDILKMDSSAISVFTEVSKALTDPHVTQWESKALSNETITASNYAVLYVDMIKPNLDEIRFSILPSINQHPEEEEYLLNNLSRFESLRCSLEISMLKSKNNLPFDIFPELAEFIYISGEIFKNVLDSNALQKK